MHKVEKLRCILHYFERITRQSRIVPILISPSIGFFYSVSIGTITIRRRLLPEQAIPKWSTSINGLAPMHLTTANKIEDIDHALQVKYIHLFPLNYYSIILVFSRLILRINIS